MKQEYVYVRQNEVCKLRKRVVELENVLSRKWPKQPKDRKLKYKRGLWRVEARHKRDLEIMRFRARGLDQRAIANEVGVSLGTVCATIRRLVKDNDAHYGTEHIRVYKHRVLAPNGDNSHL